MGDGENSIAVGKLIASTSPSTTGEETKAGAWMLRSNQTKSSTSSWIFSEQSSHGSEGFSS